MAPNLCRKGFPLTVIAHRRRDAVDDLLAMGAQEAGGVPEVAKASNWEEVKA